MEAVKRCQDSGRPDPLAPLVAASARSSHILVRMPYAFHTADVFTDHLHGGNPLAVSPDARGLSDAQMQAITREFNYSETVFVFPPEQSANTRRVRIFTPEMELPFAGHPTVGCAFVLASMGAIALNGDETRIVLEEGVGLWLYSFAERGESRRSPRFLPRSEPELKIHL